MHNYTAALRIWIEDEVLDLEEITKNLGVAPTQTRQLGGAKSPSIAWTESLWEYSINQNKNSKDWGSLEEVLTSLLNIFVPLKMKIDEYGKKYDVTLWCGHFTSSFDGGPTLSPEILKKLGDFGVEMFLDTYFHSDEEKPTGEDQ